MEFTTAPFMDIPFDKAFLYKISGKEDFKVNSFLAHSDFLKDEIGNACIEFHPTEHSLIEYELVRRSGFKFPDNTATNYEKYIDFKEKYKFEVEIILSKRKNEERLFLAMTMDKKIIGISFIDSEASLTPHEREKLKALGNIVEEAIKNGIEETYPKEEEQERQLEEF